MHIGPRALPQTLDYIEGEAPASFLSRLAMANGSNLSELANILGIKLVDGKRVRFAKLSGAVLE